MSKKILYTLIILYFIFLLNFVVIKFTGSISEIQHTIERIEQARAEGVWNYNLLPLRTLRYQISNADSPWAMRNLIGNTILFMPLGFLFVMVFQDKHHRKLWSILCSFLIIMIIETLQFICKLGAFDIDDIILGMLGSIAGLICYELYDIVYKKYKKTV